MKLTNELVATEIMGWRLGAWHPHTTYVAWRDVDGDIVFRKEFLPDFLNDANAMLLVIEKMREDDWRVCIKDLGYYSVEYIKSRADNSVEFSESVQHKSLPTAVAMAALKAKGVEL